MSNSTVRYFIQVNQSGGSRARILLRGRRLEMPSSPPRGSENAAKFRTFL